MEPLSYYATIPSWLLSLDITSGEKVMCIMLSALSSRDGYCFATNDYLAQILSTTENAVKLTLGRLERGGVICIENKKTKIAGNRKIYLSFIQQNPQGQNPTGDESKPHEKTLEAFEKFYAKYPRKQKRVPALEMFKAKKLTARIEDLLRATEIYAKSVEGTEIHFIMLPTSFLNKGIWEEYVTKAEEKKSNGAHVPPLNSFDNFIAKCQEIAETCFVEQSRKMRLIFL